MIDGNCIDLLIQTFPFWAHLSGAERQLICDNTVLKHYPKGKSIHRGDEDCVGILVIKRGQLRIYIMSEDGREVTLYRLFDKDACILSASCILEAITFDVFIDAEEDTEALLIGPDVYQRISEKNIYMECFGYRLASARFSDVMWAMQQILFMGADRRLAIFLWNEISKTKSDSVKMTHDQIARYMGSAREVVSRMLKYFEGEGIVKLYRGNIQVVDRKKLHKLI